MNPNYCFSLCYYTQVSHSRERVYGWPIWVQTNKTWPMMYWGLSFGVGLLSRLKGVLSFVCWIKLWAVNRKKKVTKNPTKIMSNWGSINPNRDVIRAEGRIDSGQVKTEVFSKWVVVTYKGFVSHVKEFRIWGKQLSYWRILGREVTW